MQGTLSLLRPLKATSWSKIQSEANLMGASFFSRCKDHQPSDGLGAHRLILAAASTKLKEILLEVSSAEEELICLHLPDYTSVEVGPVMSLLYYGETWITESCAQVCQDILQVW